MMGALMGYVPSRWMSMYKQARNRVAQCGWGTDCKVSQRRRVASPGITILEEASVEHGGWGMQ